MFTSLINRATKLFSARGARGYLIRFGIFFIIVIPLAVMSVLYYQSVNQNLTELTVSRRGSFAHLAAFVLKERFDRIVDIGLSFATRIQFRKFIEAGKWEDAIAILQSAPKDFPYIDSVALFDPQGTIRAVAPPIPEIIGQNFSYRDYYKGVSKNWHPYISEVFKRAVDPKYNVVSIAVPIKSDSAKAIEPKILGILLLTVKLDTVLDWAREIDAGPGGFGYFVDRVGHVAGHPKLSSFDEVVDFSDVPAVKKVLAGEKGVEVSYNQIEREERLTAYEPIPAYGWGVIVQQPTFAAFASRDSYLRKLFIIEIFAFGAVLFFAYLILRFIRALNLYSQEEKIFLQSIGDGIIAIDRHWNITLFNKSAAKISGWDAEEVVGKPLREFFHFLREADRKENITFIEEAMLFGQTKFMENNTLLIGKNGEEIPVADSAAPIFDASGAVDGAIIIFRDAGKEREVHALRSDFAYASHQLRTPVTKALWSLEVALDLKQVSAMRAQVLMAYNAMQSVNDLMGHLLEVSEIDQGQIAPKLQPVTLKHVVALTINRLRATHKNKRLPINTQGDHAVTVNVDPDLLQRALYEIVDNAITYSPEGSDVTIEVTTKNGDITIAVQDFGAGIPSAQQALIFTKFFRGSNIDSTTTSGAGLGLFIAREYIKSFKGKIWFKSEERRGTTFYISLPAGSLSEKISGAAA